MNRRPGDERVLLAVDVGTGGARAIAVDLKGRVVAEVRRPYQTHEPRPGWAEQSSLDLAGQLLDQELTPASAAMRQELERRLHEALAHLDDDDREMILMRHFEQLANQEVAGVLGLTEAAASMRYLRALRKLRALMGPQS